MEKPSLDTIYISKFLAQHGLQAERVFYLGYFCSKFGLRTNQDLIKASKILDQFYQLVIPENYRASIL